MKPFKSFRALTALAAAAALALTATGCGVTSETSSTDAAESKGPIANLRIMVPNTPGGGYDTTARVAAKVMDDASLASPRCRRVDPPDRRSASPDQRRWYL